MLGGKTQAVTATKSAPAVTTEDASVKTASENERRRIAASYGRNKTMLGAGLLTPTATTGGTGTAKNTLG